MEERRRGGEEGKSKGEEEEGRIGEGRRGGEERGR